MTRRKLTEPARHDDGQSRELDVPDALSDRSSTLPSYEDAVGNTAASGTGYLKAERGDDKNPADVALPSLFDAGVDMHGREEEQVSAMGPGSDGRDPNTSEGQSEHPKASLKRKLFWILGVAVLCNLLGRLLLSHMRMEKHETSPPEPASDDPFWPPSREVRVHDSFGAIYGTYPIYDLLDLSTASGAIDVTVQPKPGNKTAVVRIKSRTGAIRVRFAKSGLSNDGSEIRNERDISKRVYNTEIETMSGQIRADVLHGGAGGETALSTQTGLLDLRISPIADEVSRVETSSMTGLSKVTVEAPMHGMTLKNLTALHRSINTGMLDVNYPREWQGRLHAWCEGTGRVDVSGEGLDLQGGGSDMYAWRGHNASRNGKIIEVVSEGTGMVRFKA